MTKEKIVVDSSDVNSANRKFWQLVFEVCGVEEEDWVGLNKSVVFDAINERDKNRPVHISPVASALAYLLQRVLQAEMAYEIMKEALETIVQESASFSNEEKKRMLAEYTKLLKME